MYLHQSLEQGSSVTGIAALQHYSILKLWNFRSRRGKMTASDDRFAQT